MTINSLSGHESVGIMPQGIAACAVPRRANPLFFSQWPAKALIESGNRLFKLVKCRPLLLMRIVPWPLTVPAVCAKNCA
ncbi:hypothetical protein EMIT0324P_10882 [Pseudomonas chlororaphis]